MVQVHLNCVYFPKALMHWLYILGAKSVQNSSTLAIVIQTHCSTFLPGPDCLFSRFNCCPDQRCGGSQRRRETVGYLLGTVWKLLQGTRVIHVSQDVCQRSQAQDLSCNHFHVQSLLISSLPCASVSSSRTVSPVPLFALYVIYKEQPRVRDGVAAVWMLKNWFPGHPTL